MGRRPNAQSTKIAVGCELNSGSDSEAWKGRWDVGTHQKRASLPDGPVQGQVSGSGKLSHLGQSKPVYVTKHDVGGGVRLFLRARPPA